MDDLSNYSDEEILAEHLKLKKSRLASTTMTAILPAFILIFSLQMEMETSIGVMLSVILYALLIVPVFNFEKVAKKFEAEMSRREIAVTA